MPRVSAARSSASMPRKKTAIANAATCASLTAPPSVMPATRKAISPASSAAPSRLRADDLLREHVVTDRSPMSSVVQQRSSRRCGTCPGVAQPGAHDRVGEREIARRVGGAAHAAGRLEAAARRVALIASSMICAASGVAPGRSCPWTSSGSRRRRRWRASASSRTAAGAGQRAGLENDLQRRASPPRARLITARERPPVARPTQAPPGDDDVDLVGPVGDRRAAVAARAALDVGGAAGKLATVATRTGAPASASAAAATNAGRCRPPRRGRRGDGAGRTARGARPVSPSSRLVRSTSERRGPRRRRRWAHGSRSSSEAGQQALQVVGGAGRAARASARGRAPAAHALGKVGDGAHGGDAQAAVPRGDDLRHGGHPDRVGAEGPERADLRGRLEARARTAR